MPPGDNPIAINNNNNYNYYYYYYYYLTSLAIKGLAETKQAPLFH